MATRILYVSTSTTLGGAEKTLYTLATLLDPRRFQVAGVVSLKPKGYYAQRLAEAGHRVYSLDIKGTPGLDTPRRLAGVIAETQPDIVHAIMYQAIQMCRFVKCLDYADFALLSSPRVHYRTRSGFSLWVDRVLRGADDMLLTESAASQEYLQTTLHYAPAKTILAYNGVDVQSGPVSQTERQRLRSELHVGPNEILLGSVGRLDEQKGHSYLIETVAKLRATHPVHCAIIGEGPLRKRLENLAKTLQIEDRVHFMGEQQDVQAWLSALDIFVLPSLWEGLPNALLEALGMGLPVVATKVDGIPEVVQHDVNGFLCAPKDSQALFVPIQDMILDPLLRARVGKAAQATIAARFKLSDMLNAYQSVYEKLADARQ